MAAWKGNLDGYTSGMVKSAGWVKAAAAVVLLPMMMAQQGRAWGSDGHMLINRLAGEILPASVPAFLRSKAGLDALEYYGPEPDRWRSSAEPELDAAQAPEHFIDLEYADLVGKLPRRRWCGRQGGAAGGAGAARRAGLWGVLHEAWRRHRTRQCLLEQDGYLLKDIGVGYAEAEAEGNKPFWVA